MFPDDWVYIYMYIYLMESYCFDIEQQGYNRTLVFRSSKIVRAGHHQVIVHSYHRRSFRPQVAQFDHEILRESAGTIILNHGRQTWISSGRRLPLWLSSCT
jgi:hypothetical protein